MTDFLWLLDTHGKKSTMPFEVLVVALQGSSDRLVETRFSPQTATLAMKILQKRTQV